MKRLLCHCHPLEVVPKIQPQWSQTLTNAAKIILCIIGMINLIILLNNLITKKTGVNILKKTILLKKYIIILFVFL